VTYFLSQYGRHVL